MTRPLFLLCLLLFASFAHADEAPAEWLFTGGGVYTVDPERPWAEAVAVRSGRIVYVGNDAGGEAWRGPDTRVVDLAGRMLMPGFHDAHAHPMAAGTRFLRCQLYDLEWPDAVLARIDECVAGLQPGQWLRAVGIDEAVLESGMADRALLDRHAPENPAVITPHLARIIWVNSKALAAAQMLESPTDQEPWIRTGILGTDQLGAIWWLASQYQPREYREALRQAASLANSFGITSVNEAKTTPQHWEAFRQAEAAGELTLRVNASLLWNPKGEQDPLGELIRLRQAADGPRFQAPSVKLVLDGAGASTANWIQPRGGAEARQGEIFPRDELADVVARLDAAGFDLHLHAYGDGAVREGLDAIAHAQAQNGERDRRHHMAHLALVDPEDLPRFAELGVTADVQPLWAYWNEERVEEARGLGPERTGRLIPVRSLFDASARVVAGSDWISESMNPLVAIQYAVTRRPLDGSGPAWNPAERVTVEQMLAAYTRNAAWLARQEDLTGVIAVGMAADLVVLERNLFETDPMDLKDVRVLLTLLEGVAVYSDSTSSISARRSSGMTTARSSRARQRGSSWSDSR